MPLPKHISDKIAELRRDRNVPAQVIELLAELETLEETTPRDQLVAKAGTLALGIVLAMKRRMVN